MAVDLFLNDHHQAEKRKEKKKREAELTLFEEKRNMSSRCCYAIQSDREFDHIYFYFSYFLSGSHQVKVVVT